MRYLLSIGVFQYFRLQARQEKDEKVNSSEYVSHSMLCAYAGHIKEYLAA